MKYLDFVGFGLGFNTVKGTCHTAFDPMTEKEKETRDRALAKQSRRFYERKEELITSPSEGRTDVPSSGCRGRRRAP